MTFLPLPQPKLILDLVNADGCKAELTWLPESGPNGDRTRDLSVASPKPHHYTDLSVLSVLVLVCYNNASMRPHDQ